MKTVHSLVQVFFKGLKPLVSGPGLLFSLAFLCSCQVGVSDEGVRPSLVAEPKTLEQRFQEKKQAAEGQPEDPSPVLLSDKEVKDLRKEFKKKLSLEIDNLKSNQKRSRRDSASARKQRLKDWNQKEKESRHRFFSEHTKGPERRAYVQDFIQRRKVLLGVLKDEEKQEKNDQEVKMRTLEKDQDERQKEFENHLTRKLRPSEALWNR